MIPLLIGLLVVETVALVALAVLYRRARKARRPRRVEAPNSTYKSRYVRDLESRDRWEGLDLNRLHEVNREEVEKLLEKVRDGGLRTLSGSEKEFLDRMADAHDRAAREGRTASRGRVDRPGGTSGGRGAAPARHASGTS